MSAIGSSLNPVTILQQQKSRVISDNDAGFDMDDFFAIILALISGQLAGVVTTLFRPDEKKALTEAFIKAFDQSRLAKDPIASRVDGIAPRVFAGKGYYPNPSDTPEEKREKFLSLYPRWPTAIFGDPAVSESDPRYKCIYPNQRKAFDDNNVALDVLSGHSELDQFLEFLNGLSEPVVYVCTGPTTNLAEILRTNPDLVKAKIKTIVMMNGTFGNPNPRMGYNGGLNLQDTQVVFESGIPCLIVPSSLCDSYKFPVERLEKMANNREELTDFGRLLLDITLSWERHRALKRDPNADPSQLKLASPILADPLTMLVALMPEIVGSTRRVKYTFDLSDTDKHLLHPEAATLTTVVEDPESSVFEVTSIVSPEEVLQILINHFDSTIKRTDQDS